MFSNKSKLSASRGGVFVSKEVQLVLVFTEDGLHWQDKTSGLCPSTANIRCFQYISAPTQDGVQVFKTISPRRHLGT